MTAIQKANEQPQSVPPVSLPRPLLLLLATGAGLGVASLYYSQPILGLLAADFHASDSKASLDVEDARHPRRIGLNRLGLLELSRPQ